jgi:hypothetical protein
MFLPSAVHHRQNCLVLGGKEVGLEVNPEKIKYMLMSHCKKAGQKHII